MEEFQAVGDERLEVWAKADWVEFVEWVETRLRIGGELRFANF